MAAKLAEGVEDGAATLSEQQAAYAAALQRELEGYVRSGKTERAAQVRAELRRLGVKADDPKPAGGKQTADAKKPEDAEQATA